MKKFKEWRVKRKENRKQESSKAAYRYMRVLLFLALVPYLFEQGMQRLGWWNYANITAVDWLAYGGVLVGAYFTIWALITTIDHNRLMAEEQKRIEDDRIKEQSIRDNLPLLYMESRVIKLSDPEALIFKQPISNVIMLNSKDHDEKLRQTVMLEMQLHNVGRGPAVDMETEVLVKEYQSAYVNAGSMLQNDSERKVYILVGIEPESKATAKVYHSVFGLRIKYSDLLREQHFINNSFRVVGNERVGFIVAKIDK